jgi:hypothetical protein
MNVRTAIGRLLGVSRPDADPAHHELLASLLVMAWMVEARDPYTGGHLWRVSRYAELLAEKSGLRDAQVARVAIGGFLHDLGKIGIPDAILTKRGALTDEEIEVMRTHPDVGSRLLAGHPLAALVRNAVVHHHERPDGLGYPRGLARQAIPLDARIVGICDAFDAMTSTRPYRAGMPIEAALDVVRKGLGTQFDFEFGATFLTFADTGLVEHIVGHSDDGIPLQMCAKCGPTLVLSRASSPGDSVHCRSCAGEYRLTADASGQLGVEPTGRKGNAQALEPAADVALIARVVQSAISQVSLAEMLDGVPEGSPA